MRISRQALSICLILSLSHITAMAQEDAHAPLETVEKTALAEVLNQMTMGQDSFYGKIISPAKSLDLTKSEADRTSAVNSIILNEMDSVINAFNMASEDQKVAQVREAVSKIDPDILKNGIHIQFIDGKPSAAYNRTLLLIEKKDVASTLSAEKLIETISSYRRSARPSDYAFSYSNAHDLVGSTIKETQGNDDTWKLPLAPEGLKLKEDYVIKKCRQIFGWKCATALYRTDEVLSGKDNVKFIYTGSYNLRNNPDNPSFNGDKRTRNQVMGSTGLVVFKESDKWIMMYGVDTSWNDDGISFSGIIQGEAKKDFNRLKERISLDLSSLVQSLQ